MKKLNTLLFLQGGRCFYCDARLDLEEATIDHVIPQSKGGSNNIDNLVVCCKYANHAFADYSPKHKMAVIKQFGCFPSLCQQIFPREKDEKTQLEGIQTRNQSVSLDSNAPAIKTAEAAVQNSASTTKKAPAASVENNASTTKKAPAAPAQNNASTTKKAPAAPAQNNASTTKKAPAAPAQNNASTTKKAPAAKVTKNTTNTAEPDISTAYQILLQAIDFFEESGKEAISSQIKSQMLKFMPSFKQSDYGLAQFNKFLLRAQEDKIVTLKNHQRSGNYIIKKKV